MPQEPLNAVYADENPYVQSLRVDDNQKALRQVDMGAKAISYGEPVEDTSVAILNNSVEELDAQEVETMQEDQRAVQKGTLESLAMLKREDLIPKRLAEIQDGYEESQEFARQATAPFVARIYNTPGAEYLTDSEVTQLAINDYTLDGYAKVLDAQGGFEQAGDVLNMMIVPDQGYNAAELADGSWFTSAEGMQALADHRAVLLPHEQLMFDKQFMEMQQGIESSDVQMFTEMLDVMGKNPHLSFEHYVEKVFLIGDLAGLGTGIVKGMRGLNKMKQLSKIGDNYAAALASDVVTHTYRTDAGSVTVTGDAAIHEQASKALGIPRVDAAMSGNPLKEGLKDTILNGTTTTASTETRTRTQGVTEALLKIEEIEGVQILPSEQELNEMASKWQKFMEAKDNVESVKVEKAIDGVFIEYTTPEGSFNKHVEYTIDDLGGFQEKALPLGKTLTRHVWSPAFTQGKDVSDLVNAAVIGTFKKARAVSEYDKAFKFALKPIKGNKASINKVNDLLGKMNGKDIEVSFHKLTNEGIGGTRLTEKEATSYMEVRRIFDHMHETNNNTMRREMQQRGLRHSVVNGENTYVKSYDTAEDASKAYHFDVDNNQVAKVGEDGTSSISSITKEQLDAEYARGNVLIKSEAGDQYSWFKDHDNNHSRYALVSKDNVNALPEKVLPYTPNYVPRLRNEANYFIKRKVNMKVNGNNVKRDSTVAWARTDTQAKKWLEQYSKTQDNFDPEEWVVAFDREGGDASDATTIRMNGGLYRGSRSSSGLKYAGDNTDGDIVDALDTLQGAIRYTSDRMAMSEMRQTLRHRWYQDAGAIDRNILKLSWGEARGAIADSGAPLQVQSKLLSAHDQISNISSIPAKSEQAFQGALRAIGKHFDAKGKENAARYFYNKSAGGSPINTLKGGAFHMMLGAFNPAQFVVQFMGATVAVGANPVSFTKAVPRIMAASLTDLADNKAVRGKALQHLREKKIITKDMERDIEFWRDSGMFESVLRNNADFDNSGKFLPTDANAVQRAFSSLADKSTVFYEMGELGSMRTSFFTALEQIKAQKGDKFVYNEEALQAVVARAEQYRLGMSSANKAEYQKGILALPTQFKSIYTKSLEAMLGKQFTGAEKARIGLSQMALFGATGVPFINYFQDTLAEAFLPEDASPEEQQAFKKGAVGWLISGVWDIDAELATRTAVAGDIVKEVEDMLFSEEPFLKSFLGASFTTTDKAVSGFMNMFAAGKVMWENEQLDSIEKVGFMAKHLGVQLAQLPTSGRRLMEAYILQATKEVRTSTGRTLYSKLEEDADMRTVWARALGFSSEDQQDIYETNQAIFDRKEKVRAIADTYLNMMNTMTLGVEEQDEVAVEAAQMALRMINESTQNDQDRQDIIKAVKAALQDREFGDRTVMKWLELQTSDLFSAKGKVFPYGEKKFREVTE